MRLYRDILIGLIILATGLAIIAGGDVIASLIVGVALFVMLAARWVMYKNL